jgi:hypothetical protein
VFDLAEFPGGFMYAKVIVSLLLALLMSILTITGCGDSNPVDSDENQFDAIGLFALGEEDTLVKYINGEVIGQFTILVDSNSPRYQLLFLQDDGDINVPSSDEWSLGWEISDVSVSDVVSTETDHEQYQIQYSGLKEGQTDIVIQIYHRDIKDFESDKIPIVVTKSDPRPKK